jgi:hypothetical protein
MAGVLNRLCFEGECDAKEEPMIALAPRRMNGKMLFPKVVFAVGMLLAFSASAAEPGPAAWNGVWWQIWGEFTPMKVVVSDGKVIECLYKGKAQPAMTLKMIALSGGRLSFGNSPDFVATLTMTGANRASGHFHGAAGESDVAMEREK